MNKRKAGWFGRIRGGREVGSDAPCCQVCLPSPDADPRPQTTCFTPPGRPAAKSLRFSSRVLFVHLGLDASATESITVGCTVRM